MKGAVNKRIIQQSLPADDGARLFKVGAHHDQQIVLKGVL
jgi:hypothetical protein